MALPGEGRSRSFEVWGGIALALFTVAAAAQVPDLDLGPGSDPQLFVQGFEELGGSLPPPNIFGNNQATVTQDGSSNTAIVSQYGGYNDVRASQAGNGNVAGLVQFGVYNSITLTQIGSANEALIGQAGSYNSATVAQNGIGNYAYILQLGNGMNVSVTQTGNNQVARVVQRN